MRTGSGPRLTRSALGLAGIAAVVVVTVDGVVLGAAVSAMRSTRGWLLVLMLPLALLSLMLQAAQYRRIHRFAGGRIPDRTELLGASATTLLGNLLLPAAGTVGRIEVARRRYGASRRRLLVGSIAQFAALGAVAVTAAGALAAGWPLAWTVLAVGAVPVLAALGALAIRSGGAPSGDWVFRIATVELFRFGLMSLRLLIPITVLTGSIDTGASTMAAAGSASSQLIPLIPAGLGVREALITLGGSLRGVDPGAAVITAVLDRLVATGVAGSVAVAIGGRTGGRTAS